MNHWVDVIRFPELEANLVELDTKLAAVYKACSESDDPDQFGLFDDAEELVGLGFLFCQMYMVRRRGDADKAAAYSLGSHFRSYSYAVVINAAANFWKHCDEWPDVLGRREQNIIEIFEDAGVVQQDYRLSNLLHALDPESRLVSLLPHLVNWREALDCRLVPGAGSSKSGTAVVGVTRQVADDKFDSVEE